MKPRMIKTWPLLLSIASLVFLMIACDENDPFADDPISINGKVTEQTESGLVGLPGVHVFFSDDPGGNSADERSTSTNSSGKYYLSVFMDNDRSAPLRFQKFGYYEQDHWAHESRGDQSISAQLLSVTDPQGTGNCTLLCARFNQCEYFFDLTYESREQCLEHCNNGCQLAYLSCAYDFNDQNMNENDKCDELYSCYLDNCDLDYFNPGDDDTGDDDNDDNDDDDNDDDDNDNE